jgi:endonuclease III
MNRSEINNTKSIISLLKDTYGLQEFHPHHSPLAELVQTILSQNTSDINSRPAYRALVKTFDTWDKILTADIDQIARPINSGGLAQIKAQRIQKALREIKQRRGEIDLNFLSEIPVPKAREWLKQLTGVGNKPANCVLLFALGKPALPVDTHIFRVSKRLGLVPEKASLDEAHIILETQVPPEDIFQFHVLMIKHGRQICRAKRTHCAICVLKSYCNFYVKSTMRTGKDR